LKDGGTDRASLDGVMGGTRALQVCRDICNGAKHLVINQPSVDAAFSIGREYAPPRIGSDSPDPERWFVIAGGDKYDALALVDECVAAWQALIDSLPQPPA
jgi:hypothetical protein